MAPTGLAVGLAQRVRYADVSAIRPRDRVLDAVSVVPPFSSERT
jgi:hypothetical protein